MLSGRDDIFAAYGPEAFEQACLFRFSIVDRATLEPSGRVLYLLERNE